MQYRSLFVLVLVTLALALSGCLGIAPTDQQTGTNVSVTVSNTDSVSHDVRLFVLSGPVEGFETTYANGSTRRFEATSLGDVPYSALWPATDLTVFGEDVQTRRDTIDPGTGLGTTFDGVARNATVVYAYSPPDDSLEGFGVVSCDTDDEILRAVIEIGPDRSGSVSVFCRG